MRDFSNLYCPEMVTKNIPASMNALQERDMGYSDYSDAIILPFKFSDGITYGGVLTQQGDFLENTSVHTKFGRGYAVSKSEDEIEKAIYLGMFLPVWGHCLTDNLQRLWFLRTKMYLDSYVDYPLIYVPMCEKYSDSFIRLLEILNVDWNRLIPITKVTTVKSLIIPDECFYTLDGSLRYFTQEYVDLIDTVRLYAIQNKKELPCSKFYFTYSNYGSSQNVGEIKLEKFFAKQGYQIISPEKYSLDEQLNILINCTSFASTAGSCGHNMIFLPDDAEVILIPRAVYLTGYQLALDELRKQDIHYIDSSYSVFAHPVSPWWGPFYFYPSKQLMDYFDVAEQERNEFTNQCFDDFKKYVWTASERGTWQETIHPYYQSIGLEKETQKNRWKVWILEYKLLRKSKSLIKKLIHKKEGVNNG